MGIQGFQSLHFSTIHLKTFRSLSLTLPPFKGQPVQMGATTQSRAVSLVDSVGASF